MSLIAALHLPFPPPKTAIRPGSQKERILVQRVADYARLQSVALARAPRVLVIEVRVHDRDQGVETRRRLPAFDFAPMVSVLAEAGLLLSARPPGVHVESTAVAWTHGETETRLRFYTLDRLPAKPVECGNLREPAAVGDA